MTLPASPSAKRGFTLVELLVAIAVLSLLIILVSKIVGGASTIATYNNSHMDSNDQARLVFDRMALDFSRMLKRPDADIIFCKNTDANSGYNDTMFFFSESAGDAQTTNNGSSASSSWSNERNNIALVGYRINNDANAADNANYGQLERLGKALPWDVASTGNSNNYGMVYLTYPPAGSTSTSPPSGVTSTAYTASTILGAFNTSAGNAIGTLSNFFTDSTDSDYHVLGSQVFRFEYSFLLKDGTQSDLPIIQTTYNVTTNPNGAPTYAQRSGPPTGKQDINTGFYAGSRLYDSTNHIGYICANAGIQGLTGYAIWKQIGTQDIAAIVVTIATLDNATRYFIKTSGNTAMIDSIAAQFPKYTPAGQATASTPNTPSPADNLVTSWENQIIPASGTQNSPLANAVPGIPQTMISRIRIYQRFFYLNTP